MYMLYGIPNCNTVKNARTYLENKKIPFEFIDFKKYTPTENNIRQWSKKFGGLPVNKSGLTYKKYKDVYEKLTDTGKVKFIQENTSMIKRPILTDTTHVLAFGFSEDLYADVV
ncbi:MAG: arsenate reductase [Bdellovibrio sp. 28-41-41]|nr:MAG: arsenate reductase [Bdellovibrio sp. 28-41-41]